MKMGKVFLSGFRLTLLLERRGKVCLLKKLPLGLKTAHFNLLIGGAMQFKKESLRLLGDWIGPFGDEGDCLFVVFHLFTKAAEWKGSMRQALTEIFLRKMGNFAVRNFGRPVSP